MRILVVDDDKKMTNLLKKIIEPTGYICDVAHSGQDALDMILQCKMSKGKAYMYDLLLTDKYLGDIDGVELMVTLRLKSVSIPVIFISCLSSIDNRVRALEFGADDFLCKNDLHKSELVSRVRAVLRRSYRHTFSRFTIGTMEIDFHMQVCKIKGKTVSLTNKEYSMLELLCLHGPGAIVSKEKFISHLYSNNEPSEPKIIDVFACKLRSKIAKVNNGRSYIETVWGRGYTLNENAQPIRSDKVGTI
ncbi:MAG: transcriptional activator protein czcR [Candidatus Xenolissoclinum pacificiensis L6]|uniref:Transcriptional activator protein czcR n=1 Tax=Candidatus Xenolissoclinum pacificiensis L6 TaxID=1401685 RepID=W2V2B9_9RICK|nr:MAG: transcriptional activator protein czcR [Candidatus Xenolissoclinum pacificiensis L6]